MKRALRMAAFAAGGVALLAALALGLAWAFLPREWISQEARRQAAQLEVADVGWKKLEPGLSGFSIGVRIEDLAVRMPKEGDPRLDLRAREVFVRFKLLPLLFRRVEIAAARVSDAGIASWDRGPIPDEAGAAKPPAEGLALVLPRLELDGIDIRSRDLYGGGIDVRRLRGTVEIGGTLQAPSALRVEATAESLFWKGSARDPLLALPAPLRVDLAMKGKGTADKGTRLDVTKGEVVLGPLKSEIQGAIAMPPGGAPAQLDLSIVGAPQQIRSTDQAFRALAGKSPATWSTKASWNVKVDGTAEKPVQSGRVSLRPIDVKSGANQFSLDEVKADWKVTPDRRFTATASGGGSGLSLRLDANGSTEPGGEARGTFRLDAPASRLNGLAPNTPTWTAGALGVVASFASQAPAPPVVAWTVTGRDLAGSAPGVQPPIKKLAFTIAGDAERVEVRSLDANVGSTKATVSGKATLGKPPLPGKPAAPTGAGAFQVHLDRFIAEEWTPPAPAKGAAPAAKPGTAAPPPLPFRLLTADVTVGEVRQGGMTVRDLRVPVRFEDGTLDMDPIRGAMGSGTLAGALTVRELMTKPSYALKLDVQKAPVEEFARGLLPFQLGLSGALSGNVDLSGPGLPGAAVADSLRGNLSGTVEEGKIADTAALHQIRSALGIGEGADLVFKTISHALRIERGRLLLDKVRGDLGADKFELTGALGIDQSLNLGLVVRLAPERLKGSGALAKFAGMARDADGRIPIELGIGGTTKAPKVQLKAGKLLDVAGQGLKESLTKSLTKSLADKVAPRAGADSTAAGAGAATDSAGARTDTTKADDPRQKARDALKRLLGK